MDIEPIPIPPISPEALDCGFDGDDCAYADEEGSACVKHIRLWISHLSGGNNGLDS